MYNTGQGSQYQPMKKPVRLLDIDRSPVFADTDSGQQETKSGRPSEGAKPQNSYRGWGYLSAIKLLNEIASSPGRRNVGTLLAMT